MINTRKAALSLAVLLGTALALPVLADGASDFQANITKAQGTLSEMTKLLDGIGSHSTAAVETTGGTAEVANASATYKCPACGMEMATSPSGKNTQKAVFKGKTYYCCTGCDMSKYVDKGTAVKKPGKRPAKKP